MVQSKRMQLLWSLTTLVLAITTKITLVEAKVLVSSSHYNNDKNKINNSPKSLIQDGLWWRGGAQPLDTNNDGDNGLSDDDDQNSISTGEEKGEDHDINPNSDDDDDDNDDDEIQKGKTVNMIHSNKDNKNANEDDATTTTATITVEEDSNTAVKFKQRKSGKKGNAVGDPGSDDSDSDIDSNIEEELAAAAAAAAIDVELDILVNEGNLNNDDTTKDSNYVNVDYVSLNEENKEKTTTTDDIKKQSLPTDDTFKEADSKKHMKQEDTTTTKHNVEYQTKLDEAFIEAFLPSLANLNKLSINPAGCISFDSLFNSKSEFNNNCLRTFFKD